MDTAALVPLVETLRCQHAELDVLARRVNEALAAGDVSPIKEALVAFEVALLAHLELEDRRLYPALSGAAAATHFKVQLQVIETYQKNMAGVSVVLRSFFEEHAAGSLDVEALRRDWTLILQLLVGRIENEESTLYPLYRSLVDGEP